MRVWRCVHKTHTPSAWTGEGARIHGGRHNRPGRGMVYTSEHAALAVLEVMVGNITSMDLVDWRLLSADVPDRLLGAAPEGGPRDVGERFLDSGALGLRVPSAVVPGTNVLLNPAGRDWHRVTLRTPHPLDPRLWRSP